MISIITTVCRGLWVVAQQPKHNKREKIVLARSRLSSFCYVLLIMIKWADDKKVSQANKIVG